MVRVIHTVRSKVLVKSLLCLFCCLQPNFGASLHILKVEIGGDAQTTGESCLETLQLFCFDFINISCSI